MGEFLRPLSKSEIAKVKKAVQQVVDVWEEETSYKQVLEILAQNPGAFIPLADLAANNEGEITSKQQVFDRVSYINRVLEPLGVQVERTSVYRLAPRKNHPMKRG